MIPSGSEAYHRLQKMGTRVSIFHELCSASRFQTKLAGFGYIATTQPKYACQGT